MRWRVYSHTIRDLKWQLCALEGFIAHEEHCEVHVVNKNGPWCIQDGVWEGSCVRWRVSPHTGGKNYLTLTFGRSDQRVV